MSNEEERKVQDETQASDSGNGKVVLLNEAKLHIQKQVLENKTRSVGTLCIFNIRECSC